MPLIDFDSKNLDDFEGAILSWLRSRKGGDLGNASPRRLTKAILTALDRAAISWDDGDLIYPNMVQVSMGNEPWDRYYGQMLDDSIRRLERLITEHIERERGIVKNLQVRLLLDPALLGSSVRITVSHDERSARSDAIEQLTVKARGTSQGPATVLLVDEGGVMTVESNVDASDTAVAQLRFGDTTYDVYPDTSIGTLRYPAKPGPDLELPLASCPGTSQIHGRFLHETRTGSWSFANEGRNGTLVLHGSEAFRLDGSDQTTLADGDRLVLGCREAEVRFTCTSPDGTDKS